MRWKVFSANKYKQPLHCRSEDFSSPFSANKNVAFYSSSLISDIRPHVAGDEDFLLMTILASDFCLEIRWPRRNVGVEFAEFVDAIREPQSKDGHENEGHSGR